MVELSENAYEIAKARYLEEGESWKDLCIRVGNSVSINEKDKNKWCDIFADEIYNMNFIPGGRILRNSGKLRQSMMNCACLPIGDSIEAIGETIKNALILWSYGAGIGIDFSPLREKGRKMASKGGEACITGDTELYRERKKSRDFNILTVKDLYDKVSKKVYHPHKIRSVNLNDGTLSSDYVEDILYKGIDDVYLIVTENGYRIKSTMRHRFYSEDGWKSLSEFKIGDLITVNGTKKTKKVCNRCKKERLLRERGKYIGLCESCATSIGKRSDRALKGSKEDFKHRSEAHKIYNYNYRGLRGENNPSWKGDNANEKTARDRIKILYPELFDITECQICESSLLENRREIHHIDKNPYNNIKSNLQVLCDKCHRKLHLKERLFGNGYSYHTIDLDRIKSIEYVGKEKVYDLVMRNQDQQNFIANGFVSHNSGMISFLEAIDNIAKTIETGGQRRSGCLAMCRVDHPQILEFINAKLKDKRLSYFNLSVAVTSSFLKAVENNDNINLTFAGQTTEIIKARKIWDTILENMISSGEPGLINYDNLMKNNSYWFQPISCTNLCSELPLPSFGTCCLGTLVLTSFLSGRQTNWKKLEASIYNAVRFLDNVLDVNFYPIKQTEEVTKDSRRIGLGVSGLHDYLLVKRIKYGIDSISEIEKLFKFMRDTAYKASIELSKEKGAFPKYSRSEYGSASFIRKLPAKIRMEIKDYGIRNCTLLSAQPSGTTSLLADVSSGIEPIFSMAYKRKDRVSDRYYIHNELLNHIKSGSKKKPEWLIDSSDLSPEDHLEVQSTIQRYIDNATSKTINCPSNISKRDLSRLLLEYVWDIKGLTIYVDGSKEGQVLNKINMKEVMEYVNKNKIDSFMTESDVECAGGSCEI